MDEPLRPLLPMASDFSPAYIQSTTPTRRSPSTISSLSTGTGFSIYKSSIIPLIKSAEHEVILVTCFWAPSATLELINEALRYLSAKALRNSTTINVRICFSSASLARNLLWRTDREGEEYEPEVWVGKLGLPGPEELRGLRVRVTRKFFWPWGIVHSKYVVVDRKVAVFPSCNVSWERWFEVTVSCMGDVVLDLLDFHEEFWEDGARLSHHREIESNELLPEATIIQATNTLDIDAPTTLLPSPHTTTLLPSHLHPRSLLNPCPCLPNPPPQPFSQTPLLLTTHHLLSTARHSITLFTPNLTEPTVLALLLSALSRNVSIHIRTNRSLMTAEQLVTAGTTTPTCINSLRRRSHELPGQLEISYFDEPDGPGSQHPVLREVQEYKETVPVKLHAKATIVDGERILLGSGNMDAASWQTSQELGVLIESREVVETFLKEWKYERLEV